MTRNFANWDRNGREALGALLVLLALTGTIGVRGCHGVIFLATAAMSFCPFYRVFGLKTCTYC